MGAGERQFSPSLASLSIPASSHNSLVISYGDDENEYKGRESDSEAIRDYGISRYSHSLAFCLVAAYQKYMQDVHQDQQQGHEDHRQTSLAKRLQTARNNHLRTVSPLSYSRRTFPFRQCSSYNDWLQQPQEASVQAGEPQVGISPGELMLDKHDINGQNRATLLQDQSAIFGLYNSISNIEPLLQYTQQSDIVRKQGPAESQHGLITQTSILTSDMISTEAASEERSSITSIPQSSYHSLTRVQITSRDRHLTDTSGTYSYPRHGCTLPSDKPVKQKKCKLERYRTVLDQTFRCNNINLSTGKPCKSTFSRRYDLARHENTKHNANLERARCHLCQEEKKTFARHDSLLRHLRVLHPDVYEVGKQQGSSHDQPDI